MRKYFALTSSCNFQKGRVLPTPEMVDGSGQIDVKDGEWRVDKYYEGVKVERRAMVLIEGSDVRKDDFLKFCQRFMKVGQNLGKENFYGKYYVYYI